MKLKAVEFDGSNHRRVVTKTNKDIGLLYLDVDGYYYYEPNDGGGTFASNHLRDIADLLDKINKPFDERVKKDLMTMKVGSKVLIKDIGEIYSTYDEMFKELGFKDLDNSPKEIRNTYPDKKSLKKVVFIIFAVGKHPLEGIKLYGVRDVKGNEFLFNKKGLKFL